MVTLKTEICLEQEIARRTNKKKDSMIDKRILAKKKPCAERVMVSDGKKGG